MNAAAIHAEQLIIGYIVGVITATCAAVLIVELLSRWYEHIITQSDNKEEANEDEGC